MVLQKTVLFSGTIKENMRWGNKNAADEEILHACKLAQADEARRLKERELRPAAQPAAEAKEGEN